MAGVDVNTLYSYYNSSFTGNNKEVDDNIYLLEERQYYLKEQITTHPIGVINKKIVDLDVIAVQSRMCKLQGDKPSSVCQTDNGGLTTSQVLIVLTGMLLIFVVIAALYRIYIHLTMRK
jgi:hypothetical protein